MTTLSLHYTLDSQATQENDTNDDMFTTNDSNDTNDTNEIKNSPNANGINEINNDDGHFDPFAIEDNNKKFGEIQINTNESNQSNASNTINTTPKNNTTPPLTQSSQSNHAINNEKNENNDYDMYDDDDDDEEEEDEDEDLLREMEENFETAEKEKNNGIINILAEIKSRHKIPIKKQNNYPKIKPFEGNLTFTFDNINNKTNKLKPNNKINKHYVAVAPNPSKKRKKMKNKLKSQLSKTRKKQMKKHKKQIKKDDQYQQQEPEPEPEPEQEPEKEEKEEQNDDIEYILDDNLSDISDEEEDAYRAALISNKQIKISAEVRELLDIDAEEENENGEIISHKFEDEYEEKHGIVRDLLCDKQEIKQLKKFKDIYNEKRAVIHNKLRLNDDDRDLELMKMAFIDGKYKQLQNKNKNKNYNFSDLINDDNNYGNMRINFTCRNSNNKINIRNDPNYYLSENEEKNDYCCYDENGLFYDVNIIRMKIMEWNDKYNNNMLRLRDDDEEDIETRMDRKKRVQRKEMMINMAKNNDGNMNNKIEDKVAVKLLADVRNKKRRKKIKPQLMSSATDFGGFYLENGIPQLKRSNSCTFLDHKEKCIEKVQLEESKSKVRGKNNNIVSNGKRVVFQRVNSNSRKRVRYGASNDRNGCKKRRLQ